MVKSVLKDVFKKNIFIFLMTFLVCFSIGVSYSSFFVYETSDRVTQMYMDEISYPITIDGVSSNSITVPKGETTVTMILSGNEDIDSFYKLAYLTDSNISVGYQNIYSVPYGSIASNESKTIKLSIVNNSTSDKTVTFKSFGGYDFHTLDDVNVSSDYTQIVNNVCLETNYTEGTLMNSIMSDNCVFSDGVASEYVSNSTGVAFGSISSDTNGKGLYYTSNLTRTEDVDGDGTGERVYYYRGDVENNNVIFGGVCWKIVRTTEEGNIKLRYSGPAENGICTDVYTPAFTAPFNKLYGDPISVGYMFGNISDSSVSGGCSQIRRGIGGRIYAGDISYDESTGMYHVGKVYYLERDRDYSEELDGKLACQSITSSKCDQLFRIYIDSATRYIYDQYCYYDSNDNRICEYEYAYEYDIEFSPASVYNVETQLARINNSFIKVQIEDWYDNFKSNNISSDSLLSTSLYCNDRTDAQKSTYDSFYGAYNRISSGTVKPSHLCSQTEDRYNVGVGLLSADEVVYAGGNVSSDNLDFYLTTNDVSWTMTPSYSEVSDNYCYVVSDSFTYYITANGKIAHSYSDYTRSVYPVITIKSDAVVNNNGNGTYELPYILD